jgi:hypothetical protein
MREQRLQALLAWAYRVASKEKRVRPSFAAFGVAA